SSGSDIEEADDQSKSKPLEEQDQSKEDDEANDKEEPAWPPVSSPWIYPTDEQRQQNWNPQPNKSLWYIDWAAYGLPATKRMPYHLWFQNPHDDDFKTKGPRGACKYRPNDPKEGLLTVNRINDPQGKSCGTDDKGYG